MDNLSAKIGQKRSSQPSPEMNVFRHCTRKVLGIPGAVGRRLVSAVGRRVEYQLFRLALERPRFALLYYFVADRSFDREIHAVMHGKMAHEDRKQTLALEAARFTLRRNTHRLEKGLLMRPRRPVFAEGYIEETTRVFEKVVGAVSHGALVERTSEVNGSPGTGDALAQDPLLLWADDVLNDYFEAVSDTETVRRCHAVYRQSREALAKRACAPSVARRVPYCRSVEPLRTTIDDMAALAHRRRSVRWFEQRPVPREMVDRALEVALQSPSACNRQPFIFHVFDDPKLVQRVAEIPMGTKGYEHNIPSIAVIVGRQRAYFSERDRHLIYIDGSLAAMGFMYALEVQGLSSCPINWPDIEEKERQMADFLGLDPDERPVMLIAIGYPDPEGLVAYSQKKPLGEARTFNHASHTGGESK